MAEKQLKTLRLHGLDNIYTIPSTAEDVGARPDTWLPTIAEIGAAPAGFGYGEFLSGVTSATEEELVANLNSIISTMDNYTTKQMRMKLQFLGTELYFLTTIYKHTAVYAMATFQAPRHGGIFLQTIYTSDSWNPIEWVNPPMATDVEYRTTERIDGKAVYKMKDSNGIVKYRLDGETTWNSYAPIFDAAPAGFGLGKSVSAASDGNFDNCLAPGWYHLNKSQTICGVTATYWMLHVVAYADGTNVSEQHLYCSNSKGPYHFVRSKQSTTWSEFEIENPPMDAGVEYRTTERYKGKPVYRKLIEYSNTDTIGSATSVTTTNIPHDISNLDNAIRCDGKLGTYILPYLSLAGNITAVVGVTSTTIQLRISNTEWTNRNWAFDLAYTKTT